MKKVRILDCTLRDGGRIIDCAFEDSTIRNIARELTDAGIDIIELGFLRDEHLVTYQGNSTFFTQISQMNPFVEDECSTLYTAFIDYGMYDFDKLEYSEKSKVKGIRVGFTKKQYEEDKAGIVKALLSVKERGYKLFIQGVNSLGYSDSEILDLVSMVNYVKPYGYGIVDTYGGMYLEDLSHIYKLVEYNLDPQICIDIHSHNNFQSSFAFAQEIIRIAEDNRTIILDSTLNGMGKCAGNLNTELIVDYLNRKKNADYDLDKVLDIIDRYLEPIKESKSWGYSIPAFMAGIYKSHPNNIIYLTEKYRLSSKDIKYIVSAISEDKRQRYDYDNIHKIYLSYMDNSIEDSSIVENLKKVFAKRSVTVIAPGKTVDIYKQKIIESKEVAESIVIGVNFCPEGIECDYLFFANAIHWGRYSKFVDRNKCIVTSNVKEDCEGTNRVNYSSLIVEDSLLPDNSTMMLLNLLNICGVSKIYIAGFDGLRHDSENYVNDNFINSTFGMTFDEINKNVRKMFVDFSNKVRERIEVSLITPSLYEV